MLVGYGADLNAGAVNPPSHYSRKALQQAAGRGAEAVVRTLLGAPIQTRDVDMTEVYLPR
jgi:hypothetical protein